MPTTATEWLPVLAAQMDAEAPEIAKLRGYCSGNAPLPEMGRNLRASWVAFQKKARIDYGGLAVRALQSRIRPNGFRVGDNADDPAAIAAERICRDNRFYLQIKTATTDRLEVGVGYLLSGKDRNGDAMITAERPEHFTAATDPQRPWRVRAALKVWRDVDTDTHRACVWTETEIQNFSRPAKVAGVVERKTASDTWELDGAPKAASRVPVVIMRRPQGALLLPHLDVIDSINHGKLQRLVISAMQAFRQRALKSADGSQLQDTDKDGNDIDYTKMFEPAPGALWELPEGIDIWESASTDIGPLIEGEKADRRDFAAVTSTPLSVFIPEGQNQSAEGAANAKEGHVSLAQDEIDEIRPAAAMALVYALQLEGVDLAGKTVEVDFAPPALVSLSERFNAANQASATGVLARRTIQRDILGMSPEQIRQDEADVADEQLTQLLAAEDSVNALTVA